MFNLAKVKQLSSNLSRDPIAKKDISGNADHFRPVEQRQDSITDQNMSSRIETTKNDTQHEVSLTNIAAEFLTGDNYIEYYPPEDRIKVFSMNDDTGASSIIMILFHPINFVWFGRISVRSLLGTVNILGYLLKDNDSRCFSCFSPSNLNNLTFITHEAFTCDDDILSQLKSKLDNLFPISSEDNNRYVSSVISYLSMQSRDLNSKVVVLLLKKVLPDYVCTIPESLGGPFANLFNLSKRQSYFDSFEVNKILQPIGMKILSEESNSPYVYFPDSFVSTASHVLDSPTKECKNKPSIVVVIGGQNSGKSTFIRYLVNTALTSSHHSVAKDSSVALLDVDLGQPECTPSGFISLTLLQEPLLGPPFTHQHRNVVCKVWFGELTPDKDPFRYVACMAFVLKFWLINYHADSKKVPLIVNTMGWPKGLGLMLLIDLLHLLHPNYLIDLRNSWRETANYPPLHPNDISRMNGYVFNDSDRLERSPLDYEYIPLDCISRQTHKKAVSFSNPLQRSLTLMGYFSKVFELSNDERSHRFDDAVKNYSDACYSSSSNSLPNHPLLSIPPTSISFSKVALHACHATVPPEFILQVINVSIVGLCVVPENLIVVTDREENDKTRPNLLKVSPVCECVGLALVRGIDTSKNLLYLISPVPSELLENVNALICGTIEVPLSLVTNQPFDNIPYVDKAPFYGASVSGPFLGARDRPSFLKRRRP